MKIQKTLFGILLLFPFFCHAQGTIDYIEITDGFTQPVGMVNAGDGSNRMFVIERAGIIKILDLNTGNILPTPFLDIDAVVESSSGEEGLLGIVFHPDFPTSPYFYINYITPEGTSPSSNDTTRISRFTIDPNNPNLADPNSELKIIDFYQPAGNHNAGDLQFGPDGYLYASIGDGGGSGGSGSGFSQDVNSILGKMIRIDINQDDFPADDDKYYSIPFDNPYVGITGLDEIWHLGLRNPWKFSFDRMTGDMYIADVGQNAWEEVSTAASGVSDMNYGWKCREGAHQYNSCGSSPAGFDEPVFEYSHSIGKSITGGYVYRGEYFENFKGWYFCADYSFNKIFQFQGITGANPQFPNPTNKVYKPSAFGESESGELYIASYTDGTIYRIIDRSVCPPVLNLPTVTEDINLAEFDLTSNAQLGVGNFQFFAGNTIELQSGFTIPSGTFFMADIGACGMP